MPVHRQSLAITDHYRRQLSALVGHTTRGARKGWQRLSWDDLDKSFLPVHTGLVLNVAQAQRDAVNLTAGYLGAYLSSELGRRVTTPEVKTADYVGRSFNDKSLEDSLYSPLVKVKVANKAGQPDPLGTGWRSLLAVVDLDVKAAARQALSDLMDRDERIDGWRRALSGTCDACQAVADDTKLPAGTPLDIHPGCECVSEAVVRPNPVRAMASKDMRTWGTARDQKVMNEYVGTSEHEGINGWLREPDLFADESKTVAAIDKVIEKAGPVGQPLGVQRIVYGAPDELAGWMNQEGAEAEELIAEVFTDKGYGSTTAYSAWVEKKAAEPGDSMVWDLTVDPRVKAVWGANPAESELVMERGCQYLIEDIVQEEKTWRIHATVLPPKT